MSCTLAVELAIRRSLESPLVRRWRMNCSRCCSHCRTGPAGHRWAPLAQTRRHCARRVLSRPQTPHLLWRPHPVWRRLPCPPHANGGPGRGRKTAANMLQTMVSERNFIFSPETVSDRQQNESAPPLRARESDPPRSKFLVEADRQATRPSRKWVYREQNNSAQGKIFR